MTGVGFRLLGPFEVSQGAGVLTAGGGKRRALMAVLLLSANRMLTIDQLVDALWGEHPPKTALNLVQGYVSDWRTMLEPGRDRRAAGGRLVSSRGGYRLVVGEDESDLHRFKALSRDGHATAASGDLDRAADLLDGALGEWRGAALADFVEEPFHAAAAAALEQDRLETVRARASLDLSRGRPGPALGILRGAADLHPFDERLTELCMLALYRSGQQAEALTVYERTRACLADTLGADPSPALQRLHVQILKHDPSLGGPAQTPSPPAVSMRLPLPPSTLVGRAADVAAVRALVDEHRLVTLTGPGGSGKTRLALHTAATIEERGDREVVFVDLTPLRDASLVIPAIGEAVGVGEGSGASLVQRLATRRSDRPVLVVLDNVEHVLGAAHDLAAVLAGASALRVLATSREPLGIDGELLHAVAPLTLPPRGEYDPATVQGADAVRLFLDRTAAAVPGFSVRDEDAAVLSAICRRLDGLPLALELAAPWVRTLSLGGLLEELDHALGLLTLGGPDRPERQRTLRAAIDWSYQGLPPAQGNLFDRFSVFRSGACLDALAAVADLGPEILPALRGLVDRNLLVRSRTNPPRYRMLETLREYAAERLSSRPDDERSTRDRHARHFQQLAEEAGRGSRSAAAPRLLAALRDEQDEIRAALDHLGAVGRHDAALELAADVLDLWWELGHIREGYERLSRALDETPDDGSQVRTAAMTAAAFLAMALGEGTIALELSRSAATRARAAGDDLLYTAALWCTGGLLQWGHPEQRRRMLEETMAVARVAPQDNARWGWANPRTVFAGAAHSLAENLRYRDPDRARALLEEGLTAVLEAEDRHTAAFLQRTLGFLAIDRGEWAQAAEWVRSSLDSARQVGSDRSEGRSYQALAELAWARGDLDSAARHAVHALEIGRGCGHVYIWAGAASLQCRVLLETGQLDEAESILAPAAQALSRTDPVALSRVLDPVRARAARLRGSTEAAASHLAAAAAKQADDELPAGRVTYLLEAAALAVAEGDDRAALRHLDDLEAQARRIGFVIAVPDRELLESLHQKLGRNQRG